ncbi:MAG TPA: hypothetical protein VKF42_11025 [Chitinivibrionales bacterium]|nr:hypothetical protein [Chitinivibrionales bacterium]
MRNADKKQSEVVKMRISKTTKDCLVKIATKEHRTFMDQCRVAIEQWIDSRSMKITVLLLLCTAGIYFIHAHTWTDSNAQIGCYWTVDTLNDSVQWTIRDVNAQGRSYFETGDTLVYSGECKNPKAMRGGNLYYTICGISPHVVDTQFLAMGYKPVVEFFVRTLPSGGYFVGGLEDTAIVFDVFTDGRHIDTLVTFSIQSRILLETVSKVNAKPHSQITTSRQSNKFFLINGRSMPIRAAAGKFQFNCILIRAHNQ